MEHKRIWLPSLAIVAVGACAPGVSSVATVPVPAWDHRIVIPATGEEIGLARMLEAIRRSDVVVLGEQHDDPETHRAYAALLDAIGRTGRSAVVSLEMFERDVQPMLSDYLAGRVSEETFLARARPWPRYATDYRPAVELAKGRGWPVLASNVPRPLASAVSRAGLAVLDTLSPAERLNAAREVECPHDDYRLRFMEEMRTHGGTATPQPGDTLPTAAAERYYLAQCLKDETMAESIVDAFRAAPRGAVVVHRNGAFHSDFGGGVVQRVRRRAPGLRVTVVTAIPSRDPAASPVSPQTGRADIVIFTRRRPPA